MNLVYDIDKEASVAEFTVAGANGIFVKTHCKVPNGERCCKCPVELSLSRAVSMPFCVNFNSDGARELKINANGVAYMLNVIRGTCAQCKYNLLNPVKQR